MAEIDNLKRFLEAQRVGDTFDLLTGKLKITSLYLLEIYVEDTASGGLYEELKTALKASGLPAAVRRFEKITLEQIRAARQRETEEDDATERIKDTKAFDDLMTSAPDDLKLLGAFLKKRSLNSGAALRILVSAGANSLETLREVRAAETRWNALAAKIEASGVPQAGERFRGITLKAIDEAIERRREEEGEAEVDKDAKSFDDKIAAAAEPRKALGRFLRERTLNSGKLLTVLIDSAVDSLPSLKGARDSAERWPALVTKVKGAAPRVAGRFESVTSREIAVAIEESKRPSPEETKERQKQLEDAIAAVDKLRRDVAAANRETFDKKKAEFERDYNDIVSRVKDKFQLEFAEADKHGARDALDKLFKDTLDGLKGANDQIAKFAKEDRTPKDAITRGEMLKGFLITPVTLQRGQQDLTQMPEITPDLYRDPGAYREENLTYKSETTSSFASASAETVGSNLAVAGQASGGGFLGWGIAAVSVAASYVDQSIASEEASRFETASVATCGETHYCYDPRQKMRFDEVAFSRGAAARLAQIATQQGPAQRQAIVKFFEDFGSHFFREVTLGGRYEFRAKGRSYDTKDKGSLQKSVASARSWAVEAAASYKGLSGAASVASSTISGTKSATASATSYSLTTSGAQVDVTTTVLGGAHGVPRDVWKTSLQYNSAWQVIGRANPLPVWEMLADEKTAALKQMAALFEEVWVQDVFPDKRVLKVYPALRDDLVHTKIRTARELKGLIENYDTSAPSLRIFVVPSQSAPSQGPSARASSAIAGYKLISGGARAQWSGSCQGLLLTASYPDGNAWVASAIDHTDRCTGTVTAYAVYLHDPYDLWEVTMVEAFSGGGPAGLANVTATLPEGYLLTGGGARSEGGPYRLLTKSYPSADGKSWIAECKDHLQPSAGWVRAWAFGIRPRKGTKLPKPVVDSRSAFGDGPTAEGDCGSNTLLGGGARTEWNGVGGLLVASYPDVERRKWVAHAKHHLQTDHITLTAYAISQPAAVLVACAGAS